MVTFKLPTALLRAYITLQPPESTSITSTPSSWHITFNIITPIGCVFMLLDPAMSNTNGTARSQSPAAGETKRSNHAM